MMLRLRSRAATLMADRSSHQSSPSTQKPHTNQFPTSLLTSPRLRALFVTGAHSSDHPEPSPTTLISPTSILIDPFSAALGSPIWCQPPTTTAVTKPSRQTSDDSTAVIGLNSLILDNSDDDVSLISKFRSNLTIRIPDNSPTADFGTPTTTIVKKHSSQTSAESTAVVGLSSLILENSDDDVSLISKFRSNLTVRIPDDSPTTDFGTKTCSSPEPRKKSSSEDVPPRCLSAAEMESSEEYTCVISHGPNPTTTHIFDDRTVESCLFYLSDDYKPKSTTALKVKPPGSSESFLSACFTCRKRLNQNQDIYIYRGDKAFCSSHCRYQEMLVDGVEDDEKDNFSHYY